MVHRVGFIVFDQVGLLDVVGPSDVFTTANQLAESSLYESFVASVGCDYVRAESGLRLGVDVDLLTHRSRFDTLLVAGGIGFRDALTNQPLMEAIAGATKRANRVTSVCTGAFLLADIGLLDGRRATTHWSYAAELAELYPSVFVVSDEIYVGDGSVITAAGVAAGIDLALSIVEADHGIELAKSVSRRMVIYLHRAGGQSQFSERYSPVTKTRGGNNAIDALLADLVSRPDEAWSVERMALEATMSRRHFARLFREQTGTTPARWLERVRFDNALLLLDQTDEPVARIAERSGFGSVHTMRQTFHRIVGLSPMHYRALHSRGDADGA